MQLSLQNFTTMVQNFASSVQGACKYLVDFSDGSILLSIAEASSSAGLWLQWLILQVLATTRLATSFGSDVDTFVADYGLTRLPASYASGSVTLSRFTPTSQAIISPGAQVKTADGTQVFTIVQDTTQAAWNVAANGYIIPAGTTSCNVTVVAVNAGTQGNVQAGSINLISSAIAYVDTVSNFANMTGGVNAESDAALKARFSQYIQTRSLATVAAIGYAISTVQQGLSWTIQENTVAAGGWVPGSFVITIDDGSGSPSSTLLSAVQAAINAVRPLCSWFTVQGPTVTTATITLTITTNPTSNKTALMPLVQAAIIAYVNAIPDGGTLIYSRIAGVAYAVDPSITVVDAVTLNGGSSDLAASLSGAIKATTSSVTVS